MGAKQSKRSVDISGKEAENAGEVAASIAGGEGRMEPLADADALKPQLNGDAHIHETEEKQKDLDSGTPENEKDATTEKETKQQEEEKEASPLTNGDSEQKVENGESTPTPEDGKKPKKEKVKKKWSLRSISFSRKDKPKQDKKAKDEELKTNGEPEKVPEETAEIAADAHVVTENAEEVKTPTEVKEDKTPETPVTEPITNGSPTPESPKVETPIIEEPVEVQSSENERQFAKTEVEPEQLPVNGLSLEEPTKESIENEKNLDNKEEPTVVETTEIVPEITAKIEVCVEQMPLIDTKPPPLPANPPPSSVASFAVTTMAPELSNASLANTADNAILPPPSPPSPIAKNEIEPEINLTVAPTVIGELSSPVEQLGEVPEPITDNGVEYDTKETVILDAVPIECNRLAVVDNVQTESEVIEKELVEEDKVPDSISTELPSPPPELIEDKRSVSPKKNFEPEIPVVEVIEEPQIGVEPISNEMPLEQAELDMPPPPPELIEESVKILESIEIEPVVCPIKESLIEQEIKTELICVSVIPASPSQSSVLEEASTVDNLPDPSPPSDDEEVNGLVENHSIPENSVDISDATEIVINSNTISESSKVIENTKELIECNGNIEIDVAELTQSKTVVNGTEVADVECDRTVVNGEEPTPVEADLPPPEQSGPEPGSEPATTVSSPQEPVPISDKLADLIPELPEVPELKTETLQVSTNEAAVAN